MKGYKGFDLELKCSTQGNSQQYAVGETYTHDGEAELCKRGFHFCENPLDAMTYYGPCSSRYAEVEADGVPEEKGTDTKRVARSLRVVAEIGLHGLLRAGVKFLVDKVNFEATTIKSRKDSGQAAASGYSGQAAASGYRGQAAASGESGQAAASGERGQAAASGERGQAAASGERGQAAASGYRGQAAASGYRGQAAASGYRGQAAASGERGQAAVTGKNGFAIATGLEGRASGEVGCWLILAEWSEHTDGNWQPVDVQTRRVDGEKIRAGVFYQLRNGEFVEAEG